ncbi:efflux RND transporter periplasmic adaptor subunit [Novosphingobium umbonatum]|uniref:Efflux RND transporter periplasmic adaptor subunit n=1 Tax=Novosphingobium umbonatum TaxID=1908524 RepID=A0A3S2X7B0_9SPHN|nr:efflux RND transporter periplasmic adaptor subunit [Novosphingobium umbonatum]RVU07549.1 efflux RND transporter periplasmic adaptor subunit [Novosphingobium umbonatum]
MKNPAHIFRLTLAVGLTLAGLQACSKQPTPQAAETPAATAKDGAITLPPAQIAALGITLAQAQAADNLPIGSVPAVVSLPPEARVAVASPYAGTVLRLMVIAGQEVKQGDPLAVVRAAEAVQYSAALARTQAELPVAAAQASRLAQLAREGIIAPARADEARAALQALQATQAENRRLMNLAGPGSGVAKNGTITLRAPITGRVSSVSVETGGAVVEGTAPFIVENTAQLRLDLQIPERLAGQVRKGMVVHVVQNGRSIEGKLLSVSETLDPTTRALIAKASLPAGAGLIPGKSVMAAIAGQSQTKGVSIPALAVTHADGADMVFVQTPKGFRAAKVTVAGQIGDRAYLSSGLEAGAQVATSGVAELKTLAQGQ